MTDTQKGPDLQLSTLIEYYEATGDGAQSKAARLYEACLKMIETNYWPPGYRLPPESVLLEHLPVGLATIQGAMRRLVADGLVIRQRKVGSFVAQQTGYGSAFANFRFLADDQESILRIDDVTLSISETMETGTWGDFLGPQPSYILISRLVNVSDEFMVLADMYLGTPRFRPLLMLGDKELMGVNIRMVLHDRFGTPPIRAERRVTFIRLSAAQAARLQRPEGSPALLYEIREYTLRDEPLYLMNMIIPENDRTIRIS